MNFDNSCLQIDLNQISHNFDAIAKKTAGKAVMAVVKADAYGHGAVKIAKLLQGRCAFFGISSVPEALELRSAGITEPLLILGHTPVSSYPLLVQEDIRPTIFRYENALALSEEAVRQGKTAAFHFAVDTGMRRLGFQVTPEAADLCAAIAKLPGLYAEGLFSHYATADCADLQRTQEQTEAFLRFDQMLKDRGVNIPLRHIENSAGILNFGAQFEMVRAGIVLYGVYPSQEVDCQSLSVKPALKWVSQIINLQRIPAGCEISYGGTCVTQRPTHVATVPIGYADGYRRGLSNRFYVLIRGKKAPILGRICMDQMMVDVTDIPEASLFDPVTLLGSDGDETITVEALSEASDSFPYEFICGIHHRRIPRVYYEEEKPVDSSRYLPDNP